MNFLYNLGIRLYGTAARLAATRNLKARLMVAGQRRTLQTLAELRRGLPPGSRLVWFHAASLGEFEQGRPMMEMLRRERPQWRVLLTFFSPSGYEVRKNYDGADAVAYLPFDTPRAAREFVEAARPDMAVFIKYEFWGNYLSELAARSVPTYLISGIFRDSQIFFRSYGGVMRKVLRCFTRMYVQDQGSRRLLEEIGITNVTVAGDTRMDRVTDILARTVEMPEVERFAREGVMTVVFGSSWPADEDIYIPWLKQRPNVRAIIAPHEFDSERLEALRRRLGQDRTVLLSEMESQNRMLNSAAAYVIVDCFGKLASLYRYGDAAYVGGGFGHGIHNINEAAVYGIPVLFGPRHQKFREAQGLIDAGGGFSVSSGDEFESIATRLLRAPSTRQLAGKCAKGYVQRNLGATRKAFDEIFKSTNPQQDK